MSSQHEENILLTKISGIHAKILGMINLEVNYSWKGVSSYEVWIIWSCGIFGDKVELDMKANLLVSLVSPQW